MNKYSKLFSNTLILFFGTFSSKLLVFLLMPFYTKLLSPAEYGAADLIIQTSNLLIPIVSFSIVDGILRFGFDQTIHKKRLFSNCMLILVLGYAVFLFLIPLFLQISFFKKYLLIVYLYVFFASLKTLIANFIRTKGLINLFVFDGIFSSVSVVFFNILFLQIFKTGMTGFIVSTILVDALSSIFLFFIAKINKDFSPLYLNFNFIKDILLYCLPLIPTAMFWWIINVSDRYIITFLLNSSANGLYSIAYKIPTFLTLVSTIFIQAWQAAAFENQNLKEKTRFFSRVFSSYHSIILLATSLILLIVEPLTTVLVNEKYHESWIYTPYLLLSVAFSCFVTFLGTIYMSSKKNVMVLVTTIIGAICNIIGNFILIPIMGIQGAGLSTLISFFAVYIIRLINTRKFLKLSLNYLQIIINILTILLQVYLTLNFNNKLTIYSLACFVFLAMINFKNICSIILIIAKNILKKN